MKGVLTAVPMGDVTDVMRVDVRAASSDVSMADSTAAWSAARSVAGSERRSVAS